jgi:hypothetical protein
MPRRRLSQRLICGHLPHTLFSESIAVTIRHKIHQKASSGQQIDTTNQRIIPFTIESRTYPPRKHTLRQTTFDSFDLCALTVPPALFGESIAFDRLKIDQISITGTRLATLHQPRTAQPKISSSHIPIQRCIPTIREI